MTDNRVRILLAAGGTGGHITPAVATAEALRELAPNVELQFVCGSRPSELQIYRRLGLHPWVLPVAHNRPGYLERGRFIWKMLRTWQESRRLARVFRPQVAVGFGSYVSVAPLLAARLAGARLVLSEQDAHAGVATRLLAPFARALAVAQPLTQRLFFAPPIEVVGNPVRRDFTRESDRLEARKFFRLKPDRLVCFCVGGSQGAAGLNHIMLELLQRLHEIESPASRWQILWATGPAHFEAMAKAAGEIGVDPSEHVINPFIDHMALAYSAADVVIARAGALTLAELTALGRPAVLVPLPTSAGGHQAINARRLVQNGAAEIIEERDPQAAEKIEALFGQWAAEPAILQRMAEASRALGRPDAAQAVARLILTVAGAPLANVEERNR